MPVPFDLAGRPTEAIVAQGICQVPEGRQLFPHMSVLDNLQLGGYIHRRDPNHSARSALRSVLRSFSV